MTAEQDKVMGIAADRCIAHASLQMLVERMQHLAGTLDVRKHPCPDCGKPVSSAYDHHCWCNECTGSHQRTARMNAAGVDGEEELPE